MKTLVTIIGLTFASNTFASCYGLTGYAMLNCMENEKRQSAQTQYYQEMNKQNSFKPYEPTTNSNMNCTKQIVNTGAGYYVQTICK